MQFIKKYFLITLLSVLLLGNGLVWLAVWRESPRGRLAVSFLNVGQGDAILITSPTGRQVLIDGGPSRAVLRELGSAMPFYDRSIDLLIESHPDTDHIAGLNDVLEKYKVLGLMEPGVLGDNRYYQSIGELVAEKGISRVKAQRGIRIDLGGGALLKIIYPETVSSKTETNTASIVARLDYGQNSFLFVGDTPIGVERFLASRFAGEIDTDVYKVSHHGSKNSNDRWFIDKVSPEYAVISVGENRYGHPHKEVVDILVEASSTVLRTDELGTITFVSNGEDISIVY